MKKIILFVILFSSLSFLSKVSFAQAPDWIWAKSTGGSSNDYASAVAVDASNNLYVAGCFHYDIFFAKYDANGNELWTKTYGGLGQDGAYALAVDSFNHIYLAGTFESYDLIIDSITLTNSEWQDVFLAKFDTDGNVIWAKSAGGMDADRANAIAVDASQNVYITGTFVSPTIVFGTTTLSRIGGGDIFLAKYDSSGSAIWAKSAGGTWPEYVNSIALDTFDNIYITGNFYSPTLTFDSIVLNNLDSTSNHMDLYLAKYDANGNVLWAKSAGKPYYNDISHDIALDSYGNPYIIGGFDSPSINFDTITLTNNGNANIFIVKYNPNGYVEWARSAGGRNSDIAVSIDIDNSGSLYITGSMMSDTLAFGSHLLINFGSDDIFITKYDTNGNVIWAKNTQEDISAESWTIKTATSGDIYIAGYFNSDTAIFGTNTLINAGGWDIFTAKLGFDLGVIEINSAMSMSVYPNPCKNDITVCFPKKATFEIYNLNGQIIKTSSNAVYDSRIDLENLPNGLYIIKANTDKDILTRKFIKQ